MIVQDLLLAISTEETFLQYFLEDLDEMFLWFHPHVDVRHSNSLIPIAERLHLDVRHSNSVIPIAERLHVDVRHSNSLIPIEERQRFKEIEKFPKYTRRRILSHGLIVMIIKPYRNE